MDKLLGIDGQEYVQRKCCIDFCRNQEGAIGILVVVIVALFFQVTCDS